MIKNTSLPTGDGDGEDAVGKMRQNGGEVVRVGRRFEAVESSWVAPGHITQETP
jgi:hypothetical protein